MEPCTFVVDHFCDDIGPAKVVHFYEPKSGLRGMTVIDNIARGIAIGGTRMAADVTTTEVFRLARGMTYKNAAADLRHGGGKSGIIADPNQPEEKREELIRAFARAIRSLTDYAPGPDMGTDEVSMAYIQDEIGRCVGLPRALGGIPLDEIGATGYGCVMCAEIAAPRVNLDIKGATFVIEGFGNVGRPAAKFMVERGGILIGASDTKGTIYNKDGIDLEKLLKVKAETGSVLNYEKAEKLPVPACLELECDILFPNARPDSIHEKNVDKVKTKLIVQGANIPCTLAAEAKLHDKGILNIPDFIANAGGVICGAMEFAGASEDQVFPTIKFKIQKNTEELLRRVYDEKKYPRDAAIAIAKERVKAAMKYRLQRI